MSDCVSTKNVPKHMSDFLFLRCPIFCFSELTKNVLKHMSDLCVSQSAPKNASVILSELNKSAKGEGKGRCLLDMCFSGLGKREKKADVCLA